MSGIRTRRSEIDYVVLLSLRQRHCRRRSPALLTAYPGLFAVGSRRLEIVLPVACRRIRFSHPNGICRGISGRKQPGHVLWGAHHRAWVEWRDLGPVLVLLV